MGKTIEAGIVAAQMFSSEKKRQLVLCTQGLRKHWADQLAEHFHIPVRILDDEEENDSLPEFDGVLIASYAFLNRNESLFAVRTWDLLIIDEAHRLRKLYKDVLKTGKSVRNSLFANKTILITAFPLQYSLLDLYSLTQLVDETIFGSEEVFRERYMLSKRPDFAELKRRLAPCLIRTLRRQVLEFVPMTKRTSMTAAYSLTSEQKRLYKAVTDFFFRKQHFPGVPAAVHVMWTTFVQKAMGSSVPALIGILETIRQRLGEYGEDVSRSGAEAQRGEDFEEEEDESNFGDLVNKEVEDDIAPSSDFSSLRPRASVREDISPEIARLDSFIEQAHSLDPDPKTDVLLTSLKTGFQRMKDVGANEKALVFTESLHTQQYLKTFLEANSYAGKVVVFNGQNNSQESRKIYRDWILLNKGTGKISGVPGADLRQSLIDCFRDTASIMIATEAGSEGLDLQFCSFVVNYDLPFNPIQIEWRIGRCHRYGQRFDVMVVNFLNADNLADRKAYELLSDRFSLFDGMFGSSDSVFGSLESGSQLEKKIAKIMRTCRTEDEIEEAFTALQKEYETSVKSQMAAARQVLFENMDKQVIERFQVRIGRVQNRLDRRTGIFWKLLKFYYRDKYWFDDTLFTFGFLSGKEAFYQLGTRQKPLSTEAILNTRRPRTSQPIPISPSDSTAEMIYAKIKAEKLPSVRLEFMLSESDQEKYAGLLRESRSGWFRFDVVSLDGFTQSDELVYTICDENGKILPAEFAQSLMESEAVVSGEEIFLAEAQGRREEELETFNAKRNISQFSSLQKTSSLCASAPLRETKKQETESILQSALNRQVSQLVREMEQNGQALFEEETARIDRYTSDLELALELELRRLSKQIKILEESLKKPLSLKGKLEIQQQKSALKREQAELNRFLFDKQDAFQVQQEKLLSRIRNQLSGTKFSISSVFLIEWATISCIISNSQDSVTVPGETTE